MRALTLLAISAGCTFTPGTAPRDGGADSPDARPDAVIPTWSVDLDSGKGVPSSSADWGRLRDAYDPSLAVPSHLWLMQETSGSLGDSIGSVSLMPVNTPSYAHMVSGWSRLAVGTPDQNSDEGFATNAIGDLDGTSFAMVLYVALDSPPSAERTLVGVGAATDYRYVAITPSSTFKATGLGGVAPTTGSMNTGTVVHPIVIVLDETHQSYVVYSDRERLPVIWAATGGTGGLVSIGSAAFGAADARYLYAASWSGTAAELTSTDAKSVLTGLGWTVMGW